MSGNVSKVRSCQKCGKQFTKPARLSEAQWRDRKFCGRSCAATKRRVPDYEIVAIYEKGSSSTEIADLFNISATHVLRILRANGVTIRSGREAMKISHSRPGTLERISASAKGRKHSEAAKDKLRARTGPSNANWRGGITCNSQGYLTFTASPENGIHAGKCLHTVIAEWAIGRALRPGEVVHHKDRNKQNNDPRNLEVMKSSDHARLHAIAGEFVRKAASC